MGEIDGAACLLRLYANCCRSVVVKVRAPAYLYDVTGVLAAEGGRKEQRWDDRRTCGDEGERKKRLPE